MRKVAIIGLVFLVMLVALFFFTRDPHLAAYSSSFSSEDETTEQLYKNLLEELNDLEIPGLQVSVITSAGEQYNLAIGTTDYSRQNTIRTDHVLRIGSVSKVYTATMIMKLVEEKKLKLEDKLSTWFAEVDNANDITIKNLLEHTSGVYNYTEHLPFLLKTVTSASRVWHPTELYDYILKGTAIFAPGEKHLYSNSNYVLLGLIAEEVSGKDYSTLFNELLVEPLQLDNTFVLPMDYVPSQLINGYDRDVVPFGLHQTRPDNKVWPTSGYSAGAVAANTCDMAIFLKALFHNQLIRDDSLQTMLTFRKNTDEDIPQQIGYGLGLRKLVINDYTLIGHTGTIPGFGAAAFFLPETNTYITLAGNVSSLNQARLLETVITTLEGLSVIKKP